jgi:hypothetical protein
MALPFDLLDPWTAVVALLVGLPLVLGYMLLVRSSPRVPSFVGKRVVITGASRGIGEELAYQVRSCPVRVFAPLVRSLVCFARSRSLKSRRR